MISVYLAGPYSDSPQARVLDAIHYAHALVERGYSVFSPHCHYHWWHLVAPRPYEDWMAQCLAWVPKCDVLFRFGDASPGADRECSLARECGIPIVRSMDELIALERAA
jgi:nucleoside 2-deoxyribosyltransferase